MSFLKKITDFVMPVDDEEEEEFLEEGEEEKAAVKPVKAVPKEEEKTEEVPLRRVATGSGTYDYVPAYGGYSSASSSPNVNFRPSYAPPADNANKAQRPHLTVHTTKKDEISVQVCTPTEYSQAAVVADDLGSGRAVIVNYEQVAPDLQRRMCDFTNGVCYALDGGVQRISDNIVIYVPEGIDVGDALGVVSR